MKSRRTKACEIPKAVKERVWQRDKRCVLCGRFAPDPGWSNAHYIARSHGGLGIEENILTLCPDCHNRYDNGEYRNTLSDLFADYLKTKYPNWNKGKLLYTKMYGKEKP